METVFLGFSVSGEKFSCRGDKDDSFRITGKCDVHAAAYFLFFFCLNDRKASGDDTERIMNQIIISQFIRCVGIFDFYMLNSSSFQGCHHSLFTQSRTKVPDQGPDLCSFRNDCIHAGPVFSDPADTERINDDPARLAFDLNTFPCIGIQRPAVLL